MKKTFRSLVRGIFCPRFFSGVAVVLALTLPGTVEAQVIGTLNFANRISGVFIAPISGPQAGFPGTPLRGNATTNGGSAIYTGPYLAGTNYSAALYMAPYGETNENALTLLCVSTSFRTTATLGGIISALPGACLVYGYARVYVTCQVRAWDNLGGAIQSWEEALTNNSAARGSSELFYPLTYDYFGSGIPGNLTGLTSFCLYLPGGAAGLVRDPQDITVPRGATTNFQAQLGPTNGTETLQWTFNGTNLPGATSDSLVLTNVQPPDAGNYAVIVSSGVYSETSRVARLSLLPAVVITTQQPDLTVPPGVTTNLTAEVWVGSGEPSLQWTFNGTNFTRPNSAGANSTSLVLTNVRQMDAGNYALIAGRDGDYQTSRVARLTVMSSIVNIEHIPYEPWGIDVVRLTYETPPNAIIHVEAKTSPPGLTWNDYGTATSPAITNYFYDAFTTNQSRIYRLRQD